MNRPDSPLRRALRTAAIGALAGTLLCGCAPLLIGGAMVGGTMIVTDRRSSGTQIDDQSIELKALGRVGEAIGERGHVNITSVDRLVLITGEVPTEADRAAIERAVGRIDGVASLVNELAVAAPSSLGDRSKDTVVTAKVKAALIDARDLQANAFKVVTERGIVYLMGRVTEREATRSASVARGVGGVQKVVRVFELVSEAELANGRPATAGR